MVGAHLPPDHSSPERAGPNQGVPAITQRDGRHAHALAIRYSSSPPPLPRQAMPGEGTMSFRPAFTKMP